MADGMQRAEMHQYATFRQNWSNGFEIIFVYFEDGTAAVLDFKKCKKKLLADGVWRSEMPHCAKFPQTGSICCRYTTIFHFLKMVAAAILDM